MNEHPDCIKTVSDGNTETQLVPTDSESDDEGDAISIQSVQNKNEPDYWARTIWGWVKISILEPKYDIIT